MAVQVTGNVVQLAQENHKQIANVQGCLHSLTENISERHEELRLRLERLVPLETSFQNLQMQQTESRRFSENLQQQQQQDQRQQKLSFSEL